MMDRNGALNMVKAIIFDLDGTLTDTIGDLAAAVNFVLNKNGYPTHDEDKYFYFVGTGSYNLVKKASPKEISEEKLQSMLGEFFSYYGEHYLDKTVPYDNVTQMLTALKQKGIKLAVCSNKIQNMTEKVVEKYFGGMFTYVFGQNDKFPLKPDPACPLWIAEQLGAKPSEVMFVGDSGVDMKTGKNAGFTAVGVSWGFRTVEELRQNGADYIINNPLELLDIIKE